MVQHTLKYMKKNRMNKMNYFIMCLTHFIFCCFHQHDFGIHFSRVVFTFLLCNRKALEQESLFGFAVGLQLTMIFIIIKSVDYFCESVNDRK